MRKVFAISAIMLLLLCTSSQGQTRKRGVPVPDGKETPDTARRSQMDSTIAFLIDSTLKAESDSSEVKAAEQAPEDSLEDKIVSYAKTFLGKPYRLGARGPHFFDCSGLTSTVYEHFGIELPRFSGEQFQVGVPIEDIQKLRKGDLIFFGRKRSVRDIGHVGIVVDVDRERASFQFIHASSSRGVVIEDFNSSAYFLMRYAGARRILPEQ